jgi:cyanate permease
VLIYFLLFSFLSIQTDRHYSCSESGALVALIIILVLILGAIASTIFIKNNNLVLICTVVSLVIAFAILFAYCTWQRMNVRRQRARYGRPYTADISHSVVRYSY